MLVNESRENIVKAVTVRGSIGIQDCRDDLQHSTPIRTILSSSIRASAANGVYSDPEWSNGDNLPQDWIGM